MRVAAANRLSCIRTANLTVNLIAPMTPESFNLSLAEHQPPAALTAALQALWWARKGDWDKAHKLVMNDSSREAAWVHAYLHRLEGDLPNARYWYRQAGQPAADSALDDEWSAIIGILLRRE
jgi:hypothetical protein